MIFSFMQPSVNWCFGCRSIGIIHYFDDFVKKNCIFAISDLTCSKVVLEQNVYSKLKNE